MIVGEMADDTNIILTDDRKSRSSLLTLLNERPRTRTRDREQSADVNESCCSGPVLLDEESYSTAGQSSSMETTSSQPGTVEQPSGRSFVDGREI
jgi:hypothetical protein